MPERSKMSASLPTIAVLTAALASACAPTQQTAGQPTTGMTAQQGTATTGRTVRRRHNPPRSGTGAGAVPTVPDRVPPHGRRRGSGRHPFRRRAPDSSAPGAGPPRALPPHRRAGGSPGRCGWPRVRAAAGCAGAGACRLPRRCARSAGVRCARPRRAGRFAIGPASPASWKLLKAAWACSARSELRTSASPSRWPVSRIETVRSLPTAISTCGTSSDSGFSGWPDGARLNSGSIRFACEPTLSICATLVPSDSVSMQ